MNEYIKVVFRKPNGKLLRIKRQTANGIEFDEPDPIERTIGFQLRHRGAATRERMRRISQVKGWGLSEFRLQVSVEDGAIVLRGDDPDSLPEGLYALRVEVEDVHVRQPTTSIEIVQDGHDTLDVTVFEDVRDVAVDLEGCDPEIERVLDASTLDGRDALDWLASSDRRPTRRACLLNLLSSIRSRPTLSDVLIDQVHNVFMVSNDRAYMKVDRRFLGRVEALAKDPKKPFYREGEPRARIHGRLLDAIPEKDLFKDLLSFRGEGRPSLQMVIAVPPIGLSHTYAEFDLDLGNPLQDAVGFVVHMGELLDGKPTNHLDMRKKLARTRAGRFLYYRVTAG